MQTVGSDRSGRWNLPARLLHWGSAGILCVLVLYGWWMTEFPARADRLGHYGLHGSIGLLLLAVMLARLAWRLLTPRPPPVADASGWERSAARWAHRALYALVFAAGLSGVALSYTFSQPLDVSLLGLWHLPAFAPGDPDFWHEALEETHEFLVNATLWLIGLHAAAAAWHHWVRRDATMRRMLF